MPRGEYPLDARPSGFLFSAVFATVVAVRAVLSCVVLGTEDALMYKLISPRQGVTFLNIQDMNIYGRASERRVGNN